MITHELLEPLFAWIGDYIFHSDGRLTSESTGSGDDTLSWMSLFFQTILAIAGTLTWSILDCERISYNKLHYWLRSTLRIYVGFFMIVYGFAKVFLIQFQEPTLTSLLQPLGEFSPMGLAWTYMGFSPAFGIFTGLLEVIAGVLLIPRRTQTLGAFMVVGIMTHVAMMNLCFDIPVKIFSIHLAFMGFVLLWSDRKRLVAAFFKGKQIIENDYYRPIKVDFNKAIRIIKIVGLSSLFLLGIAFATIINLERHKDDKKDNFYGIWEVETYIKNSDTIPPLTTASSRWRYLIMEAKGRANVKTMNDDVNAFHFNIDSLNQLSLYERRTNEIINNFHLYTQDSTHFKIKGLLDQDSLEVHFKAIDKDKMLLVNRGFHWVNETPFNN
ncbi:DoxX family protein [Nonlabens ulvanivorans]|uniref:DoxX family protein n=1 Tax=Nonlabens ulvanivorans TaxID=906888 RepID=UPI002941CA43|nr:DoxX family protein [Nonlabens ulvanivorans]WOI21984.1 DoxX family protein [Nonlabens ulvanivorans]